MYDELGEIDVDIDNDNDFIENSAMEDGDTPNPTESSIENCVMQTTMYLDKGDRYSK